jgi:hypothetical protein
MPTGSSLGKRRHASCHGATWSFFGDPPGPPRANPRSARAIPTSGLQDAPLGDPPRLRQPASDEPISPQEARAAPHRAQGVTMSPDPSRPVRRELALPARHIRLEGGSGRGQRLVTVTEHRLAATSRPWPVRPRGRPTTAGCPAGRPTHGLRCGRRASTLRSRTVQTSASEAASVLIRRHGEGCACLVSTGPPDRRPAPGPMCEPTRRPQGTPCGAARSCAARFGRAAAPLEPA